MRDRSGLKVYEVGDSSFFNKFLFIGHRVVVLSLIVVIKIDLEFMPFLILCRDKKFSINFRLLQFFVVTEKKLLRHKFVYAPVD